MTRKLIFPGGGKEAQCMHFAREKLLPGKCTAGCLGSSNIKSTPLLASLLVQAEIEAAKAALEQAEMSAVVAATECMNMQKVHPLASNLSSQHMLNLLSPPP